MKKIIRYKLTTKYLTTFNYTQWVLNEWKETSGIGPLCSSGWLHCYNSPILAVLLNPIHASIINPRLFKCEVDGKCLEDYGMKEGWTRMRLIEEVPFPQLSPVNKVAFGILCALEVCKDEVFVKWANNWLNGNDRNKTSIEYVAASNSAYSAYIAAYDFAYYAANAAAATYAVNAANAADVAASDKNIDLIKLAKKAMKIK